MRGASGGGGRGHKGGGGGVSVEELVWRIRRLPAREPIGPTAAGCLAGLDSRACAALLKELARTGLAHRAQEFFDHVLGLTDASEAARLADVYTYTAAISICVSAQQLERALELSADMQRRGVQRNVHTHSALMNVCIKCGQLKLALDVWEDMQRDGIVPNVVTYNTLIDVYGKLGQWEQALQVLRRMKYQGIEPVTRTYNTLMIACNTSGQWQTALQLYEEMRAAGHALNTTSYNALISAHSKAGDLSQVLDTYRQMVQQGCERSVITYSSLISACEKSGEWQLALRFFDECLKDNCRPNVITFNSLITACAQGAQWEKARELFELMQQQGCMPDVVTYTALISAYERGGKWQLALQAFQAMQAKGCKPDSIVFNAIIDALWDTGCAWPQRQAAALHRRASASGLLRRAAHAAPGYLELCLHTLTAGVAVLSLYSWLADLRQKVAAEGAEALPARIAIVTGKGRGKDDDGASAAREAVAAILTASSSPFQARTHSQRLDSKWSLASHFSSASPAGSGEATGRLEATGKEVADWLAAGCGGLDPSRWAAGAAAEGGPEEAAAEAAADEATAARVASAYSSVADFEATHHLNLQAMGSGYLQERPEIVSNLLSMAQALNFSEEAAHDAVLLLDRAMSVGGVGVDGCLPLAAAACLHLALCQDMNHSKDALPALSSIATHTGLTVGAVGSMKETLLATLRHDTAAISAVRCLHLYLERLDPGHKGPRITQACLFQHHRCTLLSAFLSLKALARAALQQSELLNYRPSVVAAAVLYADRLAHAELPLWPSCLAHLSGYSTTATPELAAAIAAIQCRLREEQGRGGRSSEDRASGWMPDDTSSRGSLEAAAAQLVSWPCTPRIGEATPGGSVSSASSFGLFRSLSAAPNGGAASSSPCGPLDSPMRTNAFRRVHSSCNTFANGQQAHSPNRPGSRGVASMDIPMTYPNSPAALQQAHRRWSFSTNPSAHSSSNNNNAPQQMGSEEFARAVYSQALNDIHRQQSLALNQLHQASLSRPDSALGLQDLFSPTVAQQQQQQQQGLSMFSTQSHPPHSASYDLESPRTSFKGDTLASPNFSYSASSAHLQGFISVPQSPSAAGAELAMWQLASHMGSLGMQQPPPPPQPQQSPQPSPFSGAVRDPWGRTADEQMAASLFSNGGGGGAYGLQHCESAPAGLFQEELRQLRKLGLTETLGLGEQGQGQGMEGNKGHTVHGMDPASRFLQALYESQSQSNRFA
ncbi:probable pentatricopeptide repeat-containing protein At2g31400, chloplastic at N-terminal half [Coccomyxa sp. Obi]|nr:probable pentatricopeptide repeat-containing protein At2g31400, chloplastic at N-terminal half [Coccomyxa sp. Obi]